MNGRIYPKELFLYHINRLNKKLLIRERKLKLENIKIIINNDRMEKIINQKKKVKLENIKIIINNDRME